MPLIRDENDYAEFDKFVQKAWGTYLKVSEICHGFLALPQAIKERGQYPIDPFTSSVVEFTPWAPSQPTATCTKKGTFGIAVNLNHTDTFDDGYHCVDQHELCFVCENFNPLPTMFKIRGLCGTSQFNQKYAIIKDTNGIHYYQGDSHANITYDEEEQRWIISSMINKQRYQRHTDKYSPNITKAWIISTGSYESYFLGKQELIVESDPTCTGETNFNQTILFSSCFEDEFTCDDGSCLSMDLRCNGVINCPNDNTDEDHCTIIATDETYKKDYAPVKFVENDVMVKVDVNISMEIGTILAISEKDSLLKLKLVLNAYWFDHRVKFNNLKNDTSMNTVHSEEKEILWLPAVIFKNTGKTR